MTRADWVPWIQNLLRKIGLEGDEFNGISARTGGAESLRLVDTPNDVVRKMGRFADSSFVFETYQAISSKELSLYASRIANITRESLIAQGKGELMQGRFDSTGIFMESEVVDFMKGCSKKQWRMVQPPVEKRLKDLKIRFKKF
jgi:hypothetical protein